MGAVDQRSGPNAVFYGAISQRAERVVLRPENGTEIEAEIFQPEEELGVDYRFFVGFAPRDVAVTVSVEDGAGRELERERFHEDP